MSGLTSCCEGLLHTGDLALQGIVLVREGVHPLLQLAAVLLPQRNLRHTNSTNDADRGRVRSQQHEGGLLHVAGTSQGQEHTHRYCRLAAVRLTYLEAA